MGRADPNFSTQRALQRAVECVKPEFAEIEVFWVVGGIHCAQEGLEAGDLLMAVGKGEAPMERVQQVGLSRIPQGLSCTPSPTPSLG